MAVTAGALTLVSVADTAASLTSAAATAGTGPYTYQWYRSTTTGFTPAAGNLITGATSLTLADTGLIPGTVYFWKVVATDTGAGNTTSTATQVTGTTLQPNLSSNQFAQQQLLGMTDLRFNTNTIAAQIDSASTTTCYSGQAVKIQDTIDGIPKVVPCTANSDEVLGFINYDIKSKSFKPGDRCQISMYSNVMFLYSTVAVTRGVEVSLDITTIGGIRGAIGNTGDKKVGWALDKASAAGQLIRVWIKTPSFTVV